ncbi:MAG TPA: glycerophosphodiester phosphodiesterase [Candidatus Hydrogenedentes bacterium]|nr:glycerophosphodiester phosphodiesterase [Candidatus Hydrogenedentota bacterium]
MKAKIWAAAWCAAAVSLCAAADPVVIAHRGASGFLPEHTLEAYAAAHALGADYIEQDLVRTKDGAFICRHDIHLDDTTNVAEVFPDRKRKDGRWYAADFTLAEIRTLRAVERLPNRFPRGAADFRIPTFEEAIELVQGMNKTTGREAGIYPELKNPAFHRGEGLPMEEAFLEICKKYGYAGKSARIFVQCFDPGPLKRMRGELGSELPQIHLISDSKIQDALVTAENLAKIAEYAEGIGPDKGRVLADPELVKRAHAAKLLVHPYTLRRDEIGKGFASFDDELRAFFVEYGVDGLFTDYPGDAARFVQSLR